MDWILPLATPDIGAEEIAAVTDVLKSKWLTMGEVTSSFENEFAKKMGARHAFAVTNATAGLHIANLLLGVGPGDEVICPALTFVASANASRYAGANVVFADVISEKDLTISPADIRKKITPRTKAITVVHYAGFLCHMDEIRDIARARNIGIIEDAAHAPFAWKDAPAGERQYAGAIGDVGCFSFFSNKNMTTGEGGMVTVDDDRFGDRIRLLRSHGMTSLTLDRHKGHAKGYDVVELGYNYRIDELRAAIGLCQLKKIDGLNVKRRQVYQWYRDAFSGDRDIVVPFSEHRLEQATPHIFPVIIKKDIDKVRERLSAARIQTSKHYDLIPTFSLYRTSEQPSFSFDARNLMTLPFGPGMSKDQVAMVAGVVHGH